MSLFKKLRITKNNIVFTRIKDERDKTEIICKYCIHHSYTYSRKNNICSICISKANSEFLLPHKTKNIGYVVV